MLKEGILGKGIKLANRFKYIMISLIYTCSEGHENYNPPFEDTLHNFSNPKRKGAKNIFPSKVQIFSEINNFFNKIILNRLTYISLLQKLFPAILNTITRVFN